MWGYYIACPSGHETFLPERQDDRHGGPDYSTLPGHKCPECDHKFDFSVVVIGPPVSNTSGNRNLIPLPGNPHNSMLFFYQMLVVMVICLVSSTLYLASHGIHFVLIILMVIMNVLLMGYLEKLKW